ncbi:NAD(P)/FAD-dependent oxidoreductase [Cellulomonas composti]|uniref:Oxidoreductase n=1 Tax=Cellulomonas composti TaxID=266130 RepID=A0A511J976_9CELL|nr:FAD-dependent oxidoreductase [Cellulomonas composti]GEL94544.1 oxidoreductase [Cellulomonas composti]
MPDPRSVLVVGAGLAATQTAAALREQGFDGRLTVLGAEGVAPYDRPPLSKHLLDRPAPEWLSDEIGVDLSSLADETAYDEPARTLVVHDEGATVTTDRRELTVDVVVVATGARAVRPAGWDHALTLHTAADAAALRSRLVPGARLVVIGAGWIGGEVAGVAAAAGLDVTVVEAAPAPLAGPLGARIGALAARWYDEAGVRLVLGAQVAGVSADAVTLADGRRVPADVVLAAVGARPATAWVADALPRERDGSLRTDESFAVLGPDGPLPHVRAVGDVALRRSARHGWVPGGHWDGALHGPAEFAADLLRPGDRSPGDRAPYVFSTMLGHSLTLFGLPAPDDEPLVLGDPAGPEGWSARWYRPGTDTVTAALTVDRPREVSSLRRLFAAPTLPALPRP